MQLGLRPLSIATLTLTWVVLATGITEGRGLLISESPGIANEAVWVKAKPVVNQDLWKELDEQAERHKTTWSWTKGHASHADNNRCDELATMAARDQSKSR